MDTEMKNRGSPKTSLKYWGVKVSGDLCIQKKAFCFRRNETTQKEEYTHKAHWHRSPKQQEVRSKEKPNWKNPVGRVG